jgi:hypothetical protein
MGAQYRGLLVISLLLIAIWFGQVAWTYLLGSGVMVDRYMNGLLIVGSSTIAGFLLVWAAAQMLLLQRRLKTGFEADVVDEYGTRFEMMGVDGKNHPFMMSLSKFLPQLVAVPQWPGLHPLEAELMGFLHGYRHWPTDLAQQGTGSISTSEGFTSLYEQAMARWQIMRHMPGSGPFHRVMALARDLALVHAFKEERQTYSLKEFWKRDRVRFTLRCQPHGGIAAFVLSTFPAFKALGDTPEGQQAQRALLTGLRYHMESNMLPVNCGPVARELVDYLWRADAQLTQLDVSDLDQISPAKLESIKANVNEQWLAVLSELTINEEPSAEMEAIKVHGDGVWLRQDRLLSHLAPLLRPDVRQTLRLWDTQGGLHHPSWAQLAPLLQDANLIAATHDNQGAANGCFMLNLGDLTWGPAVKLVTDASKLGTVAQKWQAKEGWRGIPEVLMDVGQLSAHARAQAGNVDGRLAELI